MPALAAIPLAYLLVDVAAPLGTGVVLALTVLAALVITMVATVLSAVPSLANARVPRLLAWLDFAPRPRITGAALDIGHSPRGYREQFEVFQRQLETLRATSKQSASSVVQVRQELTAALAAQEQVTSRLGRELDALRQGAHDPIQPVGSYLRPAAEWPSPQNPMSVGIRGFYVFDMGEMSSRALTLRRHDSYARWQHVRQHQYGSASVRLLREGGAGANPLYDQLALLRLLFSDLLMRSDDPATRTTAKDIVQWVEAAESHAEHRGDPTERGVELRRAIEALDLDIWL